MTDKLAVVYRTGEAHKAHLLQLILKDYDIQCQVADRSVAADLVPDRQAISVYVNDPDYELARRIVEAFDRHLATQRADDEPDEELDELEMPRIWVDWPRCKRCRQVRETACPYCETVGGNFELADQEWSCDVPETESPDEPLWPLLLCHTCSEPFEPQFMRHCANCSLDLGNGTPAPDVELKPSLGTHAPAVFGWILILVALIILWMMMSST